MNMKKRKDVSIVDDRNITDIWDVDEQDVNRLKNKIHSIEEKLDMAHKGIYFDFQIIDDLFPDLSDIEKATIFVYGQWIHHRMYKDLR
ncbi:MAG: hypothetical protein R6U21_03440 [Thermoplasmatota archaeon]